MATTSTTTTRFAPTLRPPCPPFPRSRLSSSARPPFSVRCASYGGDLPAIDPILDEKRRSELAVRHSRSRGPLSRLGPAGRFLDELLSGVARDDGAEACKIPVAKGSIRAMGARAIFIPLYEFFLAHGGLYRFNFGPKSFLIVSDPGIAKHILRDNAQAYSKGVLAEILEFVMGNGLVPAEYEIWRVRRKAIVPALHNKYAAKMIGLFGEASHKLCEKLDRAASEGKDVEIESFFSRLTLDIIGKAVFNYDFDSLTEDNGMVEAMYTLLGEAEMRGTSPIPTWKIPIWKDISPQQKKVNRALKLVNETLDDLIAICKRIVGQEELQFDEEYMNEEDPSILRFLLASGDDVTSKQLRDDLVTLLIAGHETSAAVLTWTFYLLSKEPQVMSKLQDEVDSVLGDRFPATEDMKRLKYTTRIINESLRLYPHPPILARRSLEDDVLGKYPIKRGEDIFISLWNIHRDPGHWVDADRFNPERWPLDGPNPNETNQNFSYLPFGGGQRKCIGDVFATFQTVAATAMLVRRFDFHMSPKAPPVGMITGGTIHTTQGLVMTITPRALTGKSQGRNRCSDGEQ